MLGEKRDGESRDGSRHAGDAAAPEALAGVRIFAAVHIYLFHVKQAHDAGLLTFSVVSALPAPIANVISRGYISTGLFFELSGFLLAYAYLDSSGRLKTSDLAFWKSRFARVYPLYFLSLLLLVPAPALLPFTARHPTPLEVVGGATTSLTLTQAWFPSFALFWNAPAWALSAFAAFYAVFPAFGRWMANLGPRGLQRLVIVLTGVSWLPAMAYLLVNPAGDAWTATSIALGTVWLNALRFSPLTWLPQFLAGVALGRRFGLSVDRQGAQAVLRHAEDLARRCRGPGDPRVPGVCARGALRTTATWTPRSAHAPGDRQPGSRQRLAGTILVVAWVRAILRGQLLAVGAPDAGWHLVLRSDSLVFVRATAHLLGMIVWTLGLAVVWAAFVQRPMLEWLRRDRTRVPGGNHPQEPRAKGRPRFAPRDRSCSPIVPSRACTKVPGNPLHPEFLGRDVRHDQSAESR